MNYYQNDPAVAAGGERENARRVQTPLMARPVTAELADDFSLPDYKPEIRRMIGITATVSPAAHYLSPGHAEFAGPVRYSILYEGSDGGMWSADLPSEYDLDLTLDNDPTFEPDGMTAYADVVCESVTVRVTAPRRLSVRARLRADAVVLGMRRLDETVSGAAGLAADDLKRLEGSAETAEILRATNDPAEYTDTFLPDDGGSGEVRVICCRAEPLVGEVSATVEGVSVRGELYITVLLCRDPEGARPFAVTRRIPFAETVATDRAPERGASCRAWGCVTSASAEPNENGEIVATVGLALTAEVASAVTVPYTRDVYSTKCESTVVMRESDAAAVKKCMNANVTVSGGEELAALGLDSGIRIVDATANVLADSVECRTDGGRAVLTGKMRVRVVADNGAEIMGKDFDMPFRYETDLPGDGAFVGGGYSEWTVSAPVCRARPDGERLSADCELAVSARFCGRVKLPSVAEVKVGDARAPRNGCMTVCYPTADDSLWSVAKRYGADAAVLAASNGLDGTKKAGDKLTGVKYLLV